MTNPSILAWRRSTQDNVNAMLSAFKTDGSVDGYHSWAYLGAQGLSVNRIRAKLYDQDDAMPKHNHGVPAMKLIEWFDQEWYDQELPWLDPDGQEALGLH